MAALKIFVSFEFDKDGDLKNRFFEQAKRHSPHQVQSSPLNEAYPDQQWKDKARSAIYDGDVVIVLVGQGTHNAPGVRVDIGRRLKKPIFQVVPYTRPYEGVPGFDKPIRWKWTRINQKLDEAWTERQRGSNT